MKFTVKKLEDGRVELQLGINHVATFDKEADAESVVVGVNNLIDIVTGVSAFDMANAVAKELGLLDG